MKIIEWHTEKRRIDDLIPHSSNPRVMTVKQVKALQDSIEKFNFVEIPAINTDNMIIAGHQRAKIMQLIGRGSEEIDVRVPNRTLTPDEVKEYLIRSNKNTGEWDWDLLANEFELDDLLQWGFSESEFSITQPESPKVPNPPDDFKEYDADIETQHKCPKCGYAWSGEQE